MKFESLSQPVIPFSQWLRRMVKSIGLACVIIGGSLVIGVVGYHVFGGLSWLDAFLEASMILGGMGAVAPMKTVAVKTFAACYALFSGFVALSSMAIILAPWLHRLLHHMHAEPDEKDENKAAAD